MKVSDISQNAYLDQSSTKLVTTIISLNNA